MGYKAKHSYLLTWCLKFFFEGRAQPSTLTGVFTEAACPRGQGSSKVSWGFTECCRNCLHTSCWKHQPSQVAQHLCLHSHCCSVRYSPFLLVHFLPLLSHLLVRGCRSTPQYVKGVWCQHWSTASLRSVRYSHGTWGSGMENTKSDGRLREVISNGCFWCLLEVCT